MKTIQLNGISHKIRFNFNALSEYKSIHGGSGLSFEDIDIASCLSLTYAGMKEARRIECKANGIANDFSLTVEDIGEHMDMDLMSDVIAVLSEDMSSNKDKSKK